MGAFSKSMHKNIDNMKLKINDTMMMVAQGLFRDIVRDTPVLDGYLINNWFARVGKDFSTATSGVPDNTGSGSNLSIAALSQSMAFYGKDNTVTLANNLKYAYRIEYLGWSRMKAPQGMVRINLMKTAAKYR